MKTSSLILYASPNPEYAIACTHMQQDAYRTRRRMKGCSQFIAHRTSVCENCAPNPSGWLYCLMARPLLVQRAGVFVCAVHVRCEYTTSECTTYNMETCFVCLQVILHYTHWHKSDWKANICVRFLNPLFLLHSSLAFMYETIILYTVCMHKRNINIIECTKPMKCNPCNRITLNCRVDNTHAHTTCAHNSRANLGSFHKRRAHRACLQ